MPGLIACNRRWDVGSDDLVYPGFAEVVLRGIWYVVRYIRYLLSLIITGYIRFLKQFIWSCKLVVTDSAVTNLPLVILSLTTCYFWQFASTTVYCTAVYY